MSTPDQAAESNRRALLKLLAETTVSLVSPDHRSSRSDKEGGAASGVVVQRGERLFLLSALHAIGSGTWFLEPHLKSGSRTLVPLRTEDDAFRLPGDLAKVPLLPLPPCIVPPPPPGLNEGAVAKLDLAYVELDFSALRAAHVEVGTWASAVGEALNQSSVQLVVPVYRGSMGVPSGDDVFTFAGWNRPTLFPGKPVLERSLSVGEGLEFIGTRAGGALYAFRPEAGHQGHDYYHGVSGAPIVDASGQLVALVSGSPEEGEIIYGVPLVGRMPSFIERGEK